MNISYDTVRLEYSIYHAIAITSSAAFTIYRIALLLRRRHCLVAVAVANIVGSSRQRRWRRQPE